MRARRIIESSRRPDTVVQRLLESYLPKITQGNWYTLGDGSPTSSGSHGWGGASDVPAGDAWDADWEHAVTFEWGSTTAELAVLLDRLLQGRRCALAYAKHSASSYHLDIGYVAFVADLSQEIIDELDDYGHRLSPWHGFNGEKKLYRFDEFMFPGVKGLEAIRSDRGALDNTEMPGPEFYRPKQGEDPEQYMGRRIDAAKAEAEAERLRQQKQSGQRPRREGD